MFMNSNVPCLASQKYSYAGKCCIGLMVSTALYFSAISTVMATGMTPETTLLWVNEDPGTASMDVKNTDGGAELLYTQVQDLPDDHGPRLVVTQPVSRVEPGQTQQVRFILQSDTPLTVEHLKRVTFEGIPQRTSSQTNQVGINVRQDLPVLIHPANLPIVTDAWKQLKWSISANNLTIKNSSAYVVRMVPDVTFLPSKTNLKLSKTYILPGELMTEKLPANMHDDKQIKIYPVSRYGFAVSDYTATLQ